MSPASPRRPRGTGEFCWYNISVTNADQEVTFFTKLLNWTHSSAENGYFVGVDGSLFGCLSADCKDGSGQPMVLAMVQVKSVDETVAKARELGATADGIMDVHNLGRMANITDPEGAVFQIWQPIEKPGMDCDPSVHGAPSWNELFADDQDKAFDFYSKLFGWKKTPQDSPSGGQYYVLTSDTAPMPIGGLMKMPPHLASRNVKPHWNLYFTVTNVHDSVKLVKKIGGKTLCDPVSIPGVGTFVAILSPHGLEVHVITYEPQDG